MSTSKVLVEEAAPQAAITPVPAPRKQSKTKPAGSKNPQPTVGWIAVPRNWDSRNSRDQIDLWNPHLTRKEAEADRHHADTLGCEPRMIVRVDTAFTIVDGGSDD